MTAYSALGADDRAALDALRSDGVTRHREILRAQMTLAEPAWVNHCRYTVAPDGRLLMEYRVRTTHQDSREAPAVRAGYTTSGYHWIDMSA